MWSLSAEVAFFSSRALQLESFLSFLFREFLSFAAHRFFLHNAGARPHLKLPLLMFRGGLSNSVSFHKDKRLPGASRVSREWARASLAYDSLVSRQDIFGQRCFRYFSFGD